MTPRRERGILWALVVGHLLLILAYSVINPLGEAPDEADHWAYVVHIAREGELPGAKVLVLTANENPENVEAAIEAGAAGYLTKQASGEQLCEAVLAVARGGLVIAPSRADQQPPVEGSGSGSAVEAPTPLTSRQRAIVRLLSAGLTDREIAERLYVSVRTVQYDLSEVRSKTGLARRSEIARWAVIHSLG